MGFHLPKQPGISIGMPMEKWLSLPRMCLCDFAFMVCLLALCLDFHILHAAEAPQFFGLCVVNSHLRVEVSQFPTIIEEISMNHWFIGGVEICGYAHFNLVSV
jgi:hypothetical protein